MKDFALLHGVPRVAYTVETCTPYPTCLHACAEYLGVPLSYTEAMAQSGAAFRLAWNTACWDGSNVGIIHAFDDPAKAYACGIRALRREFIMLGRTKTTVKEDFKAFLHRDLDNGCPVIALGVIGPPEACVITGYRGGGDTLLGWNVF